ncbi:hypothetical protein FACS1894166_06290 [Bacilli bacterium]|nr:hypothetical protein FACS1894166_06290 [Bacilli bacterium]
MKNKKSLAHNNIKKKKILLGTLIPVSCLVIATAIVVPVVLTQCMNSYYTLNSVYPNATGTNYAN